MPSRREPGISPTPHSPTPHAARVRATGIRKAYGDAAALSGIDLAVEPGELLALLGPSGSGKTTLLRVIAGLEIPDAGRILFGDDDVTDRPVQQRGIGFVFQHYALFRHLTVFDNIAYGPRARRRDRPPESRIRSRVTDLLALVQLDGLGGRMPGQLSGGQRQRVALARALATEPRVLLLDEPFGALDAQVRKDLRRWLREIHRETGQTTIFVTHDQDEALELADRVAILHRGRLEQVGSPDAVYDDPASAFVMSFVGESARIPVEVSGATVRFAGRPLPVPASTLVDGEADLYLRPNALTPCPVPGEDLRGTVLAVRRIGAARRADIRLVDGLTEIEVELRSVAAKPGDEIGLALAGGRLFPRS